MTSVTPESSRIRLLRPRKLAVDPWRPLEVLVEDERHRDGRTLRTVTVFLVGSECPFTCVFCDLWRRTLDEATPRGAIPRQLRIALDGLDPHALPTAVKLYNASNFFEPRAVPTTDLEAVGRQVARFARVIVECHPRLVSPECRRFADQLDGELEIAMGLETVQPEVLSRLNKQMSLADFDRAAGELADAGIGTRAFVMVAPPFTPPEEAVAWAVRSVRHAFEHNVGIVSLIPTRSGSGEMERLQRAGLFASPSLGCFEQAVEGAVALGRGVVLADLWDIETFSGCAECRDARIDRLRRLNVTGRLGEAVTCPRCSAT